MEPTRSLEQLTDGELLLRLADILRQSRRSEADLVAHIAEADTRRLYAARPRPPCLPTVPSGFTSPRPKPTCASPLPGVARAPDPPRHARRRAAPPHRHRQACPAPHSRQPGRRPRAGHPLLEAPGRGARGELAPRPDAPALIRKLPEPPPPLPPRRAADLAPSGSPAPPSNTVQTQLPRPSLSWVGPKRRGRPPNSARTESAASVSLPRRLPRQASSRSPPAVTASSSPPAPGCATSSRGSRLSCAPPSPAPTSPPSSKTPSPRSSRGSRPDASVSRRPPARTSRGPGRSPPRATSLPPSAGPCTSGTQAVVGLQRRRHVHLDPVVFPRRLRERHVARCRRSCTSPAPRRAP